jgi:hypothetical protein
MALSPFRTRNQLVLVKAQSAANTDAGPVLANAMLCEPPNIDPAPQLGRSNEITGAFDTTPPYYAGAWRNFSAVVHAKGWGTNATVTPPDWADLMAACAQPYTSFSADVSGTAQAGGVNSITLAAGASATDNFYRGQVLQTVSGTGTGQTRIIVSYVGSTKVATVYPKWATTYADNSTGVVPDATTGYAIRKGVLFAPASSGYPYATIYRYLQSQTGGNATLDKTIDWQGSCRMQFSRDTCTFGFDGRGQMLDDVDVSYPGAPTFQNLNYPPLINGQVAFDDNLVKLNLSVDLGNTVDSEEDPNAVNGYSQAVITARGTTGTARMPRLLASTINIMPRLRASTPSVLTAVWGSTAGNRLSVLIPSAVPTGRTTADVNGVVHDAIAYATSGNNSGVFIYVW